MDIILIVLSIICLLTGFLGCVLPALPGPPVSYVGLLLLHFTDRVQFSTSQLLVWLGLVVLSLLLDYLIPMWGANTAVAPNGGAGVLLPDPSSDCFSCLTGFCSVHFSER